MDIVYRGKSYKISDTKDILTYEDLLNRVYIAVDIKRSNTIRLYYFSDDNNKKIYLQKNQELNKSIDKYYVKELGFQIGYRTVFILEYIGPFLIFPTVCYVKHGTEISNSNFLMISSSMWMFHFGKRLYESIFIHTFSHSTMPIKNLIKNCSYYWIFAFLISYNICNKVKSLQEISVMRYIFVAFFTIMELLNLYTHIYLMNLRPPGSVDHFLPNGFLFSRIMCPNYTAEILAWFFYSLFTGVIPSFLFTLSGGIQMYIWAVQKKNRFIHKFPQVKARGPITPFGFI